jgi:hypothetical protein
LSGGNDCVADFLNLRRGHFGKDRERKLLRSQCLGIGKRANPMIEVRKAWLQVQRYRVMQAGLDSLCG